MYIPARELREYREALRDRICSICRRSGYQDLCRVGPKEECPFDLHLAAFVEAVITAPRSRYLGDYVPRVRELVCGQCPRQAESGHCDARDLAYCGLHSFLVLGVQTVEEVHDRLHRARSPEKVA